jgi:pimeloyl-ACP methyl ester carboxylesterase
VTASAATTTNEQRSWAHYTEPSFVEIDGLRTAYRRQGSGERVVYLHGAGLTRMWLPFYAELGARHDLTAPEHPGFGDTPMPADLDDLDDYVLHYDAFFDALGLEPLHLIGHSLGGWTAAELAVFFPRRFKSLTLITPAGVRAGERIAEPGPDPFRLEPEEAVTALLNGRGGEYAEYFVQEGMPEDAVHAYAEATTFARLAWNPRYDHKLDRRLARVGIPTLVLGAEDDRIIPNAVAERYAELIPGAVHATVPGEPGQPTGHVPHLEHPAAVAALVAAHIATNS